MKVLNFTATEILPALLDKSKVQTIRPAWKDNLKCFWCDDIVKDLISHSKKKHPKLSARSYDLLDKPPRFKVKETVKLYWNQRSKHKTFCTICGKHGGPRKHEDSGDLFNKHLGTVEITEVFKIEIKKRYISSVDNWDIITYEHNSNVPVLISNSLEKDLAKRDGFKNAEQMFTYFDKAYDLSKAKEFYVYRFRWRWQSHK